MPSLRRYLIDLSYDGNYFHGFQVQPQVKTVQGELEAFLLRLLGQKVRVVPSGRTDAGVHAVAQMAHFDLNHQIPQERLFAALKKRFCRDILVRHLWVVPDCFHARYSARKKSYLYITRPTRNRVEYPFRKGYEWHISRELNFDAIDGVLERMTGWHNFHAFCKLERPEAEIVNKGPEGCLEKITRRNIFRFERFQRGGAHCFLVESSGFLRYQVRLMMKAVYLVGTGDLNERDIISLFEDPKQKKCLLGQAAPPTGLYLWRVGYPPCPAIVQTVKNKNQRVEQRETLSEG